MLRKLVSNFVVSFMFVLPNLAISGFGQWFFIVHLGWVGWWGFLGWMISAGSGFTFGVLIAMLTNSNFRVGKWRYTYSPDEKA